LHEVCARAGLAVFLRRVHPVGAEFIESEFVCADGWGGVCLRSHPLARGYLFVFSAGSLRRISNCCRPSGWWFSAMTQFVKAPNERFAFRAPGAKVRAQVQNFLNAALSGFACLESRGRSRVAGVAWPAFFGKATSSSLIPRDSAGTLRCPVTSLSCVRRSFAGVRGVGTPGTALRWEVL
jgi:hypothetical protein